MSLSQHVDHGRARLRDAGQALASKVTHILPTSEKPEARADDNYLSLPVPLVTLYVAAACPEQSKEAFRMLEATNTAFRVETSRDDTITARFAGRTQHGLEGVERLAEGLKGFASALLDTTSNEAYAAELERRFDPALGERTRGELADYNRTAKAELATILHGGADSER